METVQRMVDEAAKKAGYTVKGYHGSHNSFTVFDEGKSGLYGGIESKIGFWFGATRKGAENWVSETWGTDENNPQVYESWLKIENPKVFTTTEMDSEAIKKVDEEIADAEEKYKSLYEELNELGVLARWSVSEYISTNGKTVPENSQNVDEKTFLEAQKIADKLVSCKVMIESLRAKRGELIFTDSYEQFKTEIYKLAGKTAEDANVGGLGMRLENGAEVVKKYKESLVSQGYDGIIIKDTRFDANTIGEGKNSVQIVAFRSNQIKSADPVTYDDNGNVIPLSKRFNPANPDIRYALDADAYSYESLTKKSDLSVVTFPTELPVTESGKVDTNAVVARGRLNARKQKNPNNTETSTYVRIDDIGLDVLLSKNGMTHGIARSQETAFAVMKIGDVLKNSVAVNELNSSATRKTEMSYVLLGACRDSENLYVVRSVVSKLENDVTEIDVYQLSAVKGKKTETPTSALGGTAVTEQNSLISSESPVVSIADFLEYVKTIPLSNEVFSEDVAKKLGVERSEGTLSGDIRYALTGNESTIPDFEIASGSIDMIERKSYKERFIDNAKSAKSGFVPGIVATEIQLTNAQAGIEHAGKKL